MSTFFNVSPSFCSQASIVAPPKTPKTQGEIYKEQLKEKAKEAKAKEASERNVGDYVTIGLNTVSNIVDNAPVLHANQAPKLNYLG